MSRWLRLASLGVFLFATPSWAIALEERPQPNLRLCVDVGYSAPRGFEPFDRAVGLGTGFEVEQTPGFGFVFRLGLERFIDDGRGPDPFNPYFSARAHRLSVFNWSVGIRGYMRRHAIWRPFGELDVGVRLAGDSGYQSGLALTPRIGIACAPSGGTGLSLESGVNFMVDQPDRTVIVPIRLGIVFP